MRAYQFMEAQLTVKDRILKLFPTQTDELKQKAIDEVNTLIELTSQAKIGQANTYTQLKKVFDYLYDKLNDAYQVSDIIKRVVSDKNTLLLPVFRNIKYLNFLSIKDIMDYLDNNNMRFLFKDGLFQAYSAANISRQGNATVIKDNTDYRLWTGKASNIREDESIILRLSASMTRAGRLFLQKLPRNFTKNKERRLGVWFHNSGDYWTPKYSHDIGLNYLFVKDHENNKNYLVYRIDNKSGQIRVINDEMIPFIKNYIEEFNSRANEINKVYVNWENFKPVDTEVSQYKVNPPPIEPIKDEFISKAKEYYTKLEKSYVKHITEFQNSDWISVAPDEYTDIENGRTGVYLIYYGNELFYIGKGFVRTRIFRHFFSTTRSQVGSLIKQILKNDPNLDNWTVKYKLVSSAYNAWIERIFLDINNPQPRGNGSKRVTNKAPITNPIIDLWTNESERKQILKKYNKDNKIALMKNNPQAVVDNLKWQPARPMSSAVSLHDRRIISRPVHSIHNVSNVGVYALYHKTDLIYIGYSNNVVERMLDYRSMKTIIDPNHDINDYSYTLLPVKYKIADKIEDLLIRKYKDDPQYPHIKNKRIDPVWQINK